MATEITERPHSINFSKNEIRYVLLVSDPATAGCAVDVEIYCLAISATGNGERLASFTLYPTADGIIYCHIADYLAGIVHPQLPLLNGPLVQAAGSETKKYYIRYRQVTTADSNTDWITDIDQKKTLLYGGVEKIKFKRNNFFGYQATSKMFLTWQPAGRYVFYDQPNYLTFLLTVEAAGLTIRTKVVYTDNTFVLVNEDYAVADANILFRINTSAAARDLAAITPTKKIYYYEISVLDAAGTTVLAAPYRYYIDNVYLYSYYDLLFFNSLGGFDSVRVRGEVEWNVETGSEETEHIIYKDAFGSDRPQHQFSLVNIFRRDSFKGDAGWNKTPAEQEAMIELLLAAGIYEIMDGRWIQVLNLRKSIELRKSTDKKWSFAIEWNYSYEEVVFTPNKIDLGTGSAYVAPIPEPPVCTPVTIPGGTLLPNGTIGVAYTFGFNFGGDAPFELSAITKPAWMMIAVTGNSISFTGTPDSIAPDIEVAFTVSNCEGGSSVDFADSIDISDVVITPPSGKNAFVVNGDGVLLQLLSNALNYPLSPTTGNFSTYILEGTTMQIVAPAATTFFIEFLSSISDPPIYTTTVITGNTIAFDADPNDAATGVNNINYIRISLA